MMSGTKLLLISFILAIVPMLFPLTPQEAKVNQNKIEKEREKKQKQSRRDYDQAVKRHNKMQSKSTRASMKKTKKASGKATPLKH